MNANTAKVVCCLTGVTTFSRKSAKKGGCMVNTVNQGKALGAGESSVSTSTRQMLDEAREVLEELYGKGIVGRRMAELRRAFARLPRRR